MLDRRLPQGDVGRVASAQSEAGSELLQSVLLPQAFPPRFAAPGGFDVPDFLAAGPPDLLVLP